MGPEFSSAWGGWEPASVAMPPAVANGGVQVAMMRPDNVHQTVSRLLKDPRDRLPERYMWPDYERIDLWTPAKGDSDTVPLIDLSGLESGDPAVVERLAREVGEACEEWGFFQIVNHGVPEEVSDSHRRVGMDFLDMPVEMKEKATDPCGRYFGYGGRYERLSSRVPWMEYLAGNHTPAPEAPTLAKKVWTDDDVEGHTFLLVLVTQLTPLSYFSIVTDSGFRIFTTYSITLN